MEEKMAYFDSPKNRVKWEIELEELRQQKEDFAAGRLHDTGEIKRGAMAEGQHRKPVTFEHRGFDNHRPQYGLPYQE